MKYEQFLANAADALSGCREMKETLSKAQAALSAVPDMVHRNERLDKENAELKGENARLKAELDDWKGNAEGFQPDAYMPLPLDADAAPIRIGDSVYCGGICGKVSCITYDYNGWLLGVTGFGTKMKPEMFTHEEPDSWEKLEEDSIADSPCEYQGHAPATCDGCPYEECADCEEAMRRDLVDRAKRLAGAE